jgi:putative transposase
MSQVPLNGLSEAERTLAFERFELLRPSLEEGVPLARVARDRGIPLRTAQRWVGQSHRQCCDQ